MSLSSSFVRLVGRAPFTGKHDVAYNYRRGIEAARAGDQEALAFRQRLLTGKLLGNLLLGASGLGMASVEIGLAASENIGGILGASNAAEAGLAGAFAAGHLASAVAQGIIKHRLNRVEVVPHPGPILVRPIPTLQTPSRTERLVTDGGAFLMVGVFAQAMVEVALNTPH